MIEYKIFHWGGNAISIYPKGMIESKHSLGTLVYNDDLKRVLLKPFDPICEIIYNDPIVKKTVDGYLIKLTETHYPKNWEVDVIYNHRGGSVYI